MTVVELVQAMSERLDAAGLAYGHGTTNAWDEAAWLVLWRLGHALDALDDTADDSVTPPQRAEVEALVAQRIQTRKPVAYLTGEAWLQGVPFFVDERVIVPRSLIAEPLADGTLDVWLNPATQRVLDLCTGGGSLAVLAALAWPEVTVDASDLSADALAVARRNIDRHGLAGRIALHQGDGLAALDIAHRGRYDLILCNPPYVNRRAMAELPPEYLAEPQGALGGGADGMDLVRRIVGGARAHLAPHGLLVLEIGHEAAYFEAAFPDLEYTWLPTEGGDDRIVLMERDALP